MEDFPWRADLDQLAVLEDRDAVADAYRLVEVVGDEDDGLVQGFLQFQQLVLHVRADQRVEGAEGLVHENDLGVGGQRAGQADTLAHAAGKLVRIGPHELIHKDSALEQAAGGILLAAVCYAGFKVEHVRGHHVHVSTPEDASSARFGQSVYQFLPHAYKYNFLNAWRLEAVRLRKKGLPVFGWQNELIWWYLLSLALLVGFGWAFGWLGMVFFLGQAFVAVTLLEIINYVEHYGLHRPDEEII